MIKKKKTRKEKEIARLRRELTLTATPSGQYSFKPSPSPVQSVKPVPSVSYAHTSLKHYDYVMSDVKKTLSITSILILGNLILYFLISRNILHILK